MIERPIRELVDSTAAIEAPERRSWDRPERPIHFLPVVIAARLISSSLGFYSCLRDEVDR